MARVIRFNTSKFDVSAERPNPINPIPGESLLLWLRDRASASRGRAGFPVPEWSGWTASVAGLAGFVAMVPFVIISLDRPMQGVMAIPADRIGSSTTSS